MHAITEVDFRKCFDAEFEGLFLYAFTIVKDHGEAKDIAQSAFTKLWEKRKNIHLVRSARAFLFTTVYHLSMNAIRNKKNHERHHEEMRRAEKFQLLNTTEEKELKEIVWNAINDLSPRCREVFIRNRIDGMRYAQIAEVMRISEKTVEAQMTKSLKLLREKLTPHFHGT